MAGKIHNNDWEQTPFAPGQIILAYKDGFHRITEISETQLSYVQVADSNGKPVKGKKIDSCHKAWCRIVDNEFFNEEFNALMEKHSNIKRIMNNEL